MGEILGALVPDPPTACEFCGSEELYSVQLILTLQAVKCCECMALLSIEGVSDGQDKEGPAKARAGASAASLGDCQG